MDKTKALYGPRTQASGETNYLEQKNTSSVHNLDVVWPSGSTPERSYPLMVGLIPRPNGVLSLSSDSQYLGNQCNCDGARCYQKHGQSPSLPGNPLGWFILNFSSSGSYLTHITNHSAVISVSLISLIYCGLALLYSIMSIISS